jgi:hypothetical protein
MSKLIELEDALGEASSFTHAIFLAAAGLGDSRNTCAIQEVAAQLDERLEKARRIIDDLRNEPPADTTIDLEALKKAIKAERARRTALKAGEDQQ